MTFVSPADSVTSTKCEKGEVTLGAGFDAKARSGNAEDARIAGTDLRRQRRDHRGADRIRSLIARVSSSLFMGAPRDFRGWGARRRGHRATAAPVRSLDRGQERA